MSKDQNAIAEKKQNVQWKGIVNDVVYNCDVTRPFPKKVYLGLAQGERKTRFYNHNLSFKHKRYSNKKTLSSYV